MLMAASMISFTDKCLHIVSHRKFTQWRRQRSPWCSRRYAGKNLYVEQNLMRQLWTMLLRRIYRESTLRFLPVKQNNDKDRLLARRWRRHAQFNSKIEVLHAVKNRTTLLAWHAYLLCAIWGRFSNWIRQGCCAGQLGNYYCTKRIKLHQIRI